MKKKITFLSVALGLMMLLSNSAFAQFTEVWKKSPGEWPFTATGDNFRGAALNKATGHYLVASRASAGLPKIYVFNAATGALLDSVKIDTSYFKGGNGSVLQDIEVTSDGVIYASNLVISNAAPGFKIYRWASETDTATVAFQGTQWLDSNNPRFGDAFDVAGTGTGTVIYVGGNNAANDSVLVFTTANGDTFTNTGIRRITGQDATNGIAQITPGGEFYTSRYAGSNPVRHYNLSGTRIASAPTALTPLQSDITYLEAAGRKWLAVVDTGLGAVTHRARLINVTYGLANAVSVDITPSLGTNTAANSLGADVELQYNASDSTFTIYLLVDNNGIAAYKTGNVLLQNLAPVASNFRRTQYVPLTNQPDTVLVDVQDDNYIPKDSVWVTYNVNGGVNGKIVATLASGDSVKGTYRAVIPNSVHADGNRIAYFVTVADNQGSRATTATQGYFAGITKAALSGARGIDTNGLLLYTGYGARFRGVAIFEDSIIAVPTSRNDVVLQDDSGAVDIIEFAASGVAPAWRFKRGNIYTVTGNIANYNGRIQIATVAVFNSGKLEVINDGPGVLPKPKEIKIGDLTFAKKGEILENSLVIIHNVRLTASSLAWPLAGASGTNLTITDNEIDSITLRIPALSTSNGNPPLTKTFTLIGTAGQFDASSPYKDGYQVLSRHADDIIAEYGVALNSVSGNQGKDVVVTASAPTKIDTLNVTSYQFTVTFDSTKLQFKSAAAAGIASGFTFASNKINGGMVRVAASGATALKDSGALFTITLTPLALGEFAVNATGQFNEGGSFLVVTPGKVVSSEAPITREIVSLSNAKFTAGITNVGHIGALDGYQNPSNGFSFNGFNPVYEGSLIFGNAKDRVPNAARLVNPSAWNPGFRQRSQITVSNVGSRKEARSSFDDSTYSNPLGIFVNQLAVLDTVAGKNGYLILGYNVINKSASAINNFRIGSFFDFDLTAAGDADRGEILKDSTNQIPGVNGGSPFKINLAYTNNGTTYMGLVPLSQTVFTAGRISTNPTEVYGTRLTDSAKYTYISTFRATNTFTDGGSANDLGVFSSVGPYNIAVNDTAKGAFALVVGNSLSELLANARAAQTTAVQQYGISLQILTGVGSGLSNVLPTEFALDQNYPNPFNPTTTIRFGLPSESNVSLKVYDMLGREISSLVNTKMNAGFHEVVWNGKNANGYQVASGMYIYRVEAGSFVSTKKMMLLK